ncbi:LOW QUALITY PROTEIN: hypothetical protein HID58_049253 [Brassica napus]|uniref:Uncharacterized protein n=1 Tax=Brassica napus TaxID=3708 RepID=A0ABQ8B4H5_BRANA|nr:LOW QUALITY PROTEIN: hypothetical protein HID58_049253 [Brassica napus]
MFPVPSRSQVDEAMIDHEAVKDNTCDGFPVSNLKPLTSPETPNKETPTIGSSFVQEKLHPGAAMTTELVSPLRKDLLTERCTEAGAKSNTPPEDDGNKTTHKLPEGKENASKIISSRVEILQHSQRHLAHLLAGIGVDELEQLELKVDTSLRSTKVYTISRNHKLIFDLVQREFRTSSNLGFVSHCQARPMLDQLSDLKTKVHKEPHSEMILKTNRDLKRKLEESDAALYQSLWGASSSAEHHQQQGISSYQANVLPWMDV